jgi:alkylation response protein AidB-like acyl-CoA dehydrogenase
MTGAVPRRRSIETKVYCSELAVQVVYDAMRIVGAESYTKRTPLERLVRVAKTGVPRELAGVVSSQYRSLWQLDTVILGILSPSPFRTIRASAMAVLLLDRRAKILLAGAGEVHRGVGGPGL